MKISLEMVEFDCDVRGPGPRAASHYSKTFAIDQGQYKVLLEYDADLGCVRILDPKSGVRDVVLVPLARVVRMEPLEKKPAAKSAA